MHGRKKEQTDLVAPWRSRGVGAVHMQEASVIDRSQVFDIIGSEGSPADCSGRTPAGHKVR